MADKLKQLQQIAVDIEKNNVCPNLAQTATQLVPGEGNPDADIVFIGEAPGKNEDLKGIPFVGAAGKFLAEMLEAINLSRSDVYITNIVKYRPPDNRDPSTEEKAEFLGYLYKEFDVIKPKLIVTLGRHSMESFINDKKISEVHGKLTEVKGQYVLPLYHPAAALYNGGLRETLKQDFALIPKYLKQIK